MPRIPLSCLSCPDAAPAHSRRRAATRVLVGALVAALVAGVIGPAASQYQERLDDLERRLRDSRAADQQLERQEALLVEEVDTLRREGIRLTGEAQDVESSLIEINRALDRLSTDETRVRADLAAARLHAINLLAGLQRLARQPRQVLVVRPAGPVDMVRSSMLLKAALPQVQDKAAALKDKLDLLARLREEKRLALDRHSMTAEERERTGQQIDANLSQKRQHLNALRARRAGLQQAILSDERQAANLRDLFARIERDKRDAEARKQAADARRAADQAAAGAAATDRTATDRTATDPAATGSGAETDTAVSDVPAADPVRTAAAVDGTAADRPTTAGMQPPQRKPLPPTAFVDMPRPAAVRPFPTSRARSDLRFPVVGDVVRRFGQKDKDGIRARGISLRALTGARVIAPYDGQVKFSGPFRGYGNTVIIEHNNEYYTVLTGMARIDVVNGDWVLAGEPVGLMPAAEPAILNMELRRRGERVDPLPWLRVRKADARTSGARKG